MYRSSSSGKGGKNRKKAKNFGVEEKRELVFKEEGQEYGQVLRMLGKRLSVLSSLRERAS